MGHTLEIRGSLSGEGHSPSVGAAVVPAVEISARVVVGIRLFLECPRAGLV